jgi:hypothetical protein
MKLTDSEETPRAQNAEGWRGQLGAALCHSIQETSVGPLALGNNRNRKALVLGASRARH